MKEVKLERVAGPYKSIPFENFIQSPVGLVPKAGGQTRLIFHLSFNFSKDLKKDGLVNHHTPEHLCSVKYRDLDHAVRNCLQMWKQLKGQQQGEVSKHSRDLLDN